MLDIALDGATRQASRRIAPVGASKAVPVFSTAVLRGASAYRTLRAEWLSLAERQRGANLFQTPDLLDIWSRHFAADREDCLATVVVRGAEGRPVLIWPLLAQRSALISVARGAGAPAGQYDEILLDPDCDGAQAFAAAREALARSVRPDLIVLERVRADGALRSAIGSVLPIGDGEGAPYADLSGGFGNFMTSLKPRVARQQRKRVRRFEQEGAVTFEVAADVLQAQAWLSEALDLKREWLRSTGRFSRAFAKPETAATLADWARSLARPDASARMLVSRLALDGRTAAIEMGFRHRDAYHLYLGAFAPELGRFGPGNILTEKLLEWCAANGLSRYDMLAPRSRNKSEWQTAEVEVDNFALPTTWRGRIYVEGVLRRLLPGVRRGFYALPDAMRSTLAGAILGRSATYPGAADERRADEE